MQCRRLRRAREVFAFLKLVPLEWWIYLACTTAITGVLAHDHYVSHRARDLAAQVREKDLQLEAAHTEAREQKESSDAYHRAINAQRLGRAEHPVRVVRICPAAGGMPAAASGTAAPRTDELPRAPGRDPEEGGSAGGPDVGPDLYGLADDADEHAIGCNAVIDWINAHAPPPD